MLAITEESYTPSTNATMSGSNAITTTNDGGLAWQYDFISTRHRGGANLLFLHGHSKWSKTSQSMAGRFKGTGLAACPTN